MPLNSQDPFLPLRLPGMKGWNTYDDPSGIDDLELTDVQNMTYDKGFLARREGSDLLYSKPVGESNAPLQLITADTSDGVRYTIAVYGNHFYLRHPTNHEWIRINQTYVPTQLDQFYGYVNWNNGRGDDRLYGCNGVDDFFRWDICVTTVNGNQSSGSATVTLIDGTRFPTGGGILILKDSGTGTFFTQSYTSRSGNVFTLTGTLLHNIGNGDSATLDMIQKASMEIGKRVQKYLQRLIVANYYGGETSMFYSAQADPETFTPGTGIGDGGTEVIADGNGEITGLHDFGTFLVIEKKDSLHTFSFTIAADLSSKLSNINPIVSGQSMGPIDMGSVSKIMNTLYYPTESNGFMSLYPDTSGSNVTSKSTVLSQKIDPYVQKLLNLDMSRTAANKNKIYWASANKGGVQNVVVLEYDLLRSSWTKHFGWSVQDFTVNGNVVLYLDNSSGDIYEINDGTYADADNPYLASASFKRFDFGEIGRPKNQSIIYIQGYMTPASEFFVDVFFNEEGILGKQTYQLNKDTPGLWFSDPITDSLGNFILGEPVLGMSALEGIGDVKIFRGALGISTDFSFFNIQPRIYGTREAFFGITGMAMNPSVIPITSVDMLISPIAG